MAYMVRGLVASKAKLAAVAGADVALELHGRREDGQLVLEGGQGFVPTHSIAEVMARMARAAPRPTSGESNEPSAAPRPCG
jgi:hypothetical protein